jgi:hypothetical protein
MIYQPNFNDSRVKSTALKALNFVELYTKSNNISWITYKELFKHFGNTNRPLGKWLVATLLVTRDPYYNGLTGQCKKYSKNAEGCEQVKCLLGLKDFIPSIDPELEQQLDSGEIQYEEKSDRSFSPIQFIPKRYRNSILNNKGYRYHYDIEAAAPTLLVQRALQLNPNLDIPTLQYYISNRSQVRKEIAKACEISEDKVKAVINAILQGSHITCYSQSQIFALLDFDYDAVKRLKMNETMISLKDDIKSLWVSLRDEFSVRYLTDRNGKQRRARLSAKEKSGYYRLLEKSVGDIIRKTLTKNKIKYVWIHDGWTCDKVIDPMLIVTKVRQQTGYVIKLDWTIYED